jgi:ABC-type glutathione transport system ATPase component
MGLIFISHDLRLVSSFCDRVLVMYAGSVVEEIAATDLADAKHPYTRGLLNCLPQLGGAAPACPRWTASRSGRCEHARPQARRVLCSAPAPLCGLLLYRRTLCRPAPGAGGARPARRLRRLLWRSDTSFRVEPGASFGIVGESGSGKSTVLRAHLRAGTPERREVKLVADTDQADACPAPAARPFAAWCRWCFRTPTAALHPRQTVDRILAEPLAIHGMADAETRIERALDDVGLGRAFRFRYPHQLSGGQRQRVAVARALILEPQCCCSTSPPRHSTRRCRPRC